MYVTKSLFRRQGLAIVTQSSNPLNRIGLEVFTKGNQGTGGVKVFAITPTVLALNTLHTVTIYYDDGNVSVYLNGVLEISYSENINEPFKGTIASGSTTSNSVVLSAGSYGNFTGMAGYMPITSPVLPPGTWANTTATNGTVNLVDSDFNPVYPTSNPAGATFRLSHFFDSITVLGHYRSFFSFTEPILSARVASLSYGVGALSANDMVGMAAYFNGRANVLATPSNTTSPVITGNTKIGQVLNCSTGSWSNAPTSFRYQWYSGDMPIDGATSSAFTILASSVGDVISCSVTATNAAGSSIPKYVRLRNVLANEASTVVWDFVSDSVGSSPSGIVAANGGNLLVKNTGAAFASGKYISDQATTSVTNAYNLTGAQPLVLGSPQRIRATLEAGVGVGFILQAQAGTTVAGFPGMLQGYYLKLRPNSGSSVHLATSAGLVDIATSRFYTWPTKGTYHVQVTWENMRVQVHLSNDGVNYNLAHEFADVTYQTATAPCQLITGMGAGAPNTTYITQLSYFS